MKTKLYRKFVKLICKDFKISRKQLFSRDFNECVIPCYTFDLNLKKLTRDLNRLFVLLHNHPLSQIWEAFCFSNRWLLKYWQHSHWKPYIQAKIDLGYKEDDVILDILKRNPK